MTASVQMPPVVAQQDALAQLEQYGAQWRDNLPAQRPYLASLPADLAGLRGATGQQKILVQELRRVSDEITDEHWLRVYSHKPALTQAARRIFDARTPEYRPWSTLQVAGQIALDARQELWERDVGDNMPALALAALLWDEEKYRVALKNHVLAACYYPTWGAGEGIENRDLSCAHLARGIAIARDWLPSLWEPDELQLIRDTIARQAGELLQALYGGAYWHKNWVDNHCQNSVAALGMCGLAFFDELPAATEWLAAAECGFEQVARLCHSDGTSPEGIPYWSYGASFLLQYIETTRQVTGSDRFYQSPYLQNSFNYRLQSSTPDLGATLPFGDAVKHDYYGPGHLLVALARQYRNPHAQWLAEQIPFRQTGGADCEAWHLLWHDPELETAPPALELDAHLPVWDVAITRSGWEANDYVLAIKSGYTNRNHSHLDAGALILAWGDEWLLTAPGYGIVGPGFWDFNGGGRWTYYSNSTESHSTLLINGLNQRFDRAARGTITHFETTPDGSRTVIDLTDAYAGVKRVQREVVHQRGAQILITDDIELHEKGTVEWLLQPGGQVELVEGQVYAQGKNGGLRAQMHHPALAFAPRQSTQLHLDVATESVRTHSVSQSGTTLRFVCQMTLHKQ